MTTATGIHDHPDLKLGLREPSLRATVNLADYVRTVPDHPLIVDDTTEVTYALDNNDRFGVCGPTSLDNLIRTVSTRLTGTQRGLTWDQIVELYRMENPGFDPDLPADDPNQDDHGVDLATMLTNAVTLGFILGFAQIDVSNDDDVRAGVYLFTALANGVQLQVAQQTQTPTGIWYYSPSPTWGGHAVCEPAYEPDGEDVITWAQRVRMARSFISGQRQQAFAVLLPEHLEHPDFRAGFDLESFEAAFQAITDEPFPGQPGAASFLDPAPEVGS